MIITFQTKKTVMDIPKIDHIKEIKFLSSSIVKTTLDFIDPIQITETIYNKLSFAEFMETQLEIFVILSFLCWITLYINIPIDKIKPNEAELIKHVLAVIH